MSGVRQEYFVRPSAVQRAEVLVWLMKLKSMFVLFSCFTCFLFLPLRAESNRLYFQLHPFLCSVGSECPDNL